MKDLKEITKFSTQYLSYQIVATVFFKEGGLIIDISGPADHLGGIGIGIPYMRKNGKKSANFHCISFPSHRDGELAGNIARIVAKITRFYTVVILGIHLPKITKIQLDALIHTLEEWTTEWSHQLINEIFSGLEKVK